MAPLIDFSHQPAVGSAQFGGADHHSPFHAPFAQQRRRHVLRQKRGQRDHQQGGAGRNVKAGEQIIVGGRTECEKKRRSPMVKGANCWNLALSNQCTALWRSSPLQMVGCALALA